MDNLADLLTWIVVILVGLVYAAIVGYVTRALLGTPVGRPRTYIIGLIVFGLSWPFALFTADQAGVLDADGHLAVSSIVALLFIALAFGWVFAFGVAALVLAEALWPTRALPNPVVSFREALHRRRRTRRYLQIIGILSRHGVGWIVQGRARPAPGAASGAPHPGHLSRANTPEAIVSAINEAGVTFVKLGQVLSTRRDLLPAPYIAALSSLQSAATTLPWPTIRTAIEQEIGGTLESVYASVDEEPLAAASVAQVHTGTLLDGTAVVLKVQRPGAAEQVAADVDIIVRLATRVEAKTSWGREFGAVSLATGFSRSLSEELDYRIEFANTRQIGHAVEQADTDVLMVPRVFGEASSRRLLTMERVDGIPLSSARDRLATMDADDRTTLASALLDAVLEQIVVQGIFHADLHPGNLMLRDDGRLGMIDFGAVGVLERSLREMLVTLLLAAANEDDVAATDALLMVVETPPDADIPALQRDIGRVLTLMKHGGDGQGSIFSALLDVVREHHLGIPSSLGMAFRSIITLESCLAILQPDFDMVENALERMPHYLTRIVGPKTVLASLQTQAALWRTIARRTPRRIEALSDALGNGTFGVRVRSFAAPEDRWWVGEIVTESIGALIAIAFVTLGIVLIVVDEGPLIAPNVPLYSFIGATIGLVGFVLILRALRRLFVRRPR